MGERCALCSVNRTEDFLYVSAGKTKRKWKCEKGIFDPLIQFCTCCSETSEVFSSFLKFIVEKKMKISQFFCVSKGSNEISWWSFANQFFFSFKIVNSAYSWSKEKFGSPQFFFTLILQKFSSKTWNITRWVFVQIFFLKKREEKSGHVMLERSMPQIEYPPPPSFFHTHNGKRIHKRPP
jgi:hypothetical protein